MIFIDILYNQEKYDEAFEICQQMCFIKEKYYPSDHVQFAVEYDRIGDVLNGQCKYDEALEFKKRALIIREKNYPSNDVTIAHTLFDIGEYFKKSTKI